MYSRASLLIFFVACGGPQSTTTGATGGATGATSAAEAGFTYTIAIDDPSGALTASHDDLTACARGGLDEWARYLEGKGTVSVRLTVESTPTGRLGGASTSNVPFGTCKRGGDCRVVEEQAIHRLRTGQDNPAAPGDADIALDVDPKYWSEQVWVDPDPSQRTSDVPDDRLDCVSLMTHELGHAFGFTGFRDLATFQPTAPVQSLFDELVVVGKSGLTFVGPQTTEAFGGPIVLTSTNTTQNIYHYGDKTAPSEIDTMLMNGISYENGKRYRVQRLDVIMLRDLGVPVRAEPSS